MGSPTLSGGRAARKSDLDDRLFWMPNEEEIKDAVTTDVYFEYARDALKFAGINPVVTMEVFTRKNPWGARWAGGGAAGAGW